MASLVRTTLETFQVMEYLLRDNGMMRTNASWQGGTNESCYSRLICWGEKRQTGQIRVLATRRGVKRKHGVAVHQTTAEDAALALQPCRRLMAVMSLFPPAKPSHRRAHPPHNPAHRLLHSHSACGQFGDTQGHGGAESRPPRATTWGCCHFIFYLDK